MIKNCLVKIELISNGTYTITKSKFVVLSKNILTSNT